MDFETITNLIIDKKTREFRKAIEDLEFVDIAEIIEKLDDDYQIVALRMLPKDIAADVFAYLSIELQEQIITNINDKEVTSIIEELYVDDAVDLLDELPANIVTRVLKNAKPEKRALLNQYLNYKEYSAGSIMTAEFIDLKKDMSVKDAIEKIRKVADEKEDINITYVIDNQRKLIGICDLKALLCSKDDVKVEDIMEDSFIFCKTSDDQEFVTKLLQKYDLLALPVCDNENRLVGIITIDDAVDVIQEEAEEDFEKMAAMLPSNKPYLEMSVFSLFKNRIIWLSILMITGMITGAILESFEEAISALPLLVAFLPMLNDTGGNSGSQAATMCIRGLTTGEVTPGQWLKVWWKEFRVSILVSLALALFNFVRILCKNIEVPDGSDLTEMQMKLRYATVICGTLILAVMLAKSIGALLPLLAKKIHLDPAVCAAPMITTIVDCCTILIYFGLATTIFRGIIV